MIKNKPLVSISCVTYNHEPYIRECLDGFLMQKTDFDFEILIHDDASTDNTATIIREYELIYPEIINPIYQTENQYSKGVRPINKFNFERAQGKYIALCEGDDYWTDPLKLQKQVDFLDTNMEYSAVGHQRYILQDKSLKETKISHNILYTQCIVFRNELDEIYFKQSEGVFNGDTFLFYYLKTKGKVTNLDFYAAVYRYDGQGIYSSLSNSKKLEPQLNSFKKIYNMLNYLGNDELKEKLKKSIISNYSHQFKIQLNIKIIEEYFKDYFKFKLFTQKQSTLNFARILKILLFK